MKTTHLVLVAALASVSGAAFADYSGTREQRMQAALDNFHKGSKSGGDRRYNDKRNPSPGPVARAESSVKRGASDAGSAVKRGAKKAGHAVGTGLSKTGEAIDHAGDKLKGKSSQ